MRTVEEAPEPPRFQVVQCGVKFPWWPVANRVEREPLDAEAIARRYPRMAACIARMDSDEIFQLLSAANRGFALAHARRPWWRKLLMR